MNLKHIVAYGVIIVALFLLLTACDTSGTTGNPGSTPTQPKVVQGTALPSTPEIVPTVILTPTIVPNGNNSHSQLVTLSDRTLIITNASKKSGTDNNTVVISLTVMVKNTSAKPIKNRATYFQLTAQGDVFGMHSSANSSFFGTIAKQSSRSGTIVFQVPAGAVNGISLLYRPEVATETVFVSLNLS